MTLEMILPIEQDQWAIADWPLGAQPRPDGTTFAVYAPAATRLQLEFYPTAIGSDAAITFLPAKGLDGIWRAKLTGVTLGDLYAYRAWGMNWPWVEDWEPGSLAGFLGDLDVDGNRFNPNKVLFDPYAHEITHNMFSDLIFEEGIDNGIFATGDDDYQGKPRRQWDTGPYAPKGAVLADTTPLAAKPRISGAETAIYEVQVEQLTGHPSVLNLSELLAGEPGFEDVVGIPDELRGTYKAVGMMAPYIKALGFTTVELLPVHETNVSESGRQGLTNQWGYMTLSYFAPSRRFSSDKSIGGPTREFKEMINAFHECGVEVYLDVVYNHTAEGGNWDGDVNTVSFTSLGGFAASDIYVMTSDKMLVDGATGTSNQLNFSSAAAQQLVLDSLAYWTRVMGVDGFRFDLATVLGRKPEEAHPDDWSLQKRFFTDHPLLVEIAAWAKREHIEVIAEAWDLWGYEVGNFPRGWGEWNGRYRDAVRRFTKGDGNTQAFLEMINGDHHHFHDNEGAQKTVNFVDAHDGFTMTDLVSYQEKVNDQPYPFGPSDGGSNNNLSWDSGGSQPLRRQRVRNLWTLLFFSRGVPMVVGGDEFGRTQNGNNNPWALDSIAMTNNYAMIRTNAPHRVQVAPELPDAAYHDNFGEFENEPDVNGLFRFATFVANLRQRHDSLRQDAYGDLIPDNKDVSYLFHTPTLDHFPEEGDRAVSVFINSPEDDFWLMINMTPDPVDFAVAPAADGRVWRRLIDTAQFAEPAHNHWPEGEGMIVEGGATVEPWSIVVWHDNPEPDGSREIPVWED
ncbi:glycogen-debranching protein [Tessaracoccus sp. OS52]|uniref:alpha-amylase family glycosyl hydrolase n=1 Tax=Tessaracoccus sp. OS52 TaxID=2886691 RepID=UPI001D0F7440|nr:alpha-amylase family glycosyl hydrolase [Tessaracoccus sp. OS52]MCC2594701.1 glycogen-debranching protein [Tessaracoccus sp. OS52]